jgi:zinc/manganese transport system substrate-binding protein
MIKRLLCIVIATLSLAWSHEAKADLDVVATVPTLAAIASAVGGKHAHVTSLALSSQDPHFVDAKPSLALKLNKADLLLVVGLSLEVGWLPPLQTGARNGKIQVGGSGYLDCSTFAKLMGAQALVDRSQGDIHPGGNPHYLYDPRQVEQVAIGVAARMSELDGEHAGDYAKNLGAFLKRLHKVRRALKKRLKAHRGKKVVAYHRSWTYLTDWLGLKQVAFLEPKPGIPPNPAHIARVLGKARRLGVALLLQESYYPDGTAKLVAKKSGASLVVLPGGVDFAGGQSYMAHLLDVGARIEKGLR